MKVNLLQYLRYLQRVFLDDKIYLLKLELCNKEAHNYFISKFMISYGYKIDFNRRRNYTLSPMYWLTNKKKDYKTR